MAYTHTYPRHHASALAGDFDVSEIIKKGGPALQAAAKVIQDPALPEVTCNILRLNRAVEGKNPGPPCQRHVYTQAQKKRGVGLHLAIHPLRGYTWARQNPALAIGLGASAIALIFGLGYMLGERRR